MTYTQRKSKSWVARLGGQNFSYCYGCFSYRAERHLEFQPLGTASAALHFSGGKRLCVYQQSALVSKAGSGQFPASVFSFRKGELQTIAQVPVPMVSAHSTASHRANWWCLSHACIARRCRNPWAKATEASLNWKEATAVLSERSCTGAKVQFWADAAKLVPEPGRHGCAAQRFPPNEPVRRQTLISLKQHCIE